MAGQTDRNEWGSLEAKKQTECMVCEAMLPDAVDGLLNEAEQRAFEKHVATCTQCSEELEEAQRGAAWLQMLRGHAPEPSPLLLSRILAQTTGAESSAAATASVSTPALQMMSDGTIGPRTEAASVREGLRVFLGRKLIDIFSIQKATMHFQPRLAMTAAMAFFSVALTLNMTGVKLGSLKASNLRPSALRRSVADTTASAMRSFQNMRVVYQFESKLEDIRDASPSDGRGEESPTRGESSSGGDKQRDTEQNGQKQSPHGHSSLEFPLVRRSANVRGV